MSEPTKLADHDWRERPHFTSRLMCHNCGANVVAVYPEMKAETREVKVEMKRDGWNKRPLWRVYVLTRQRWVRVSTYTLERPTGRRGVKRHLMRLGG